MLHASDQLAKGKEDSWMSQRSTPSQSGLFHNTLLHMEERRKPRNRRETVDECCQGMKDEMRAQSSEHVRGPGVEESKSTFITERYDCSARR